MNAQLNSTNFQQFVKDNQGKKITFIHTDKQVSTFIVDVCSEYFTGKNQESDAKIDGFYYFSDCKMVDEKHPLIDVLEKHNVTTLHFTNGLYSCIFEYDEYNRGMIDGTCLTTSHPIGFNIESIKEAWTIVDGKYTKVWEKEPSQDPIILEEILKNNKYCTIKTTSRVFENFNFFSIVNKIVTGTSGKKELSTCIMVPTILSIISKDGKVVYDKLNKVGPMDKLSSYFDAQNSVKNACEKVNNTLEKLNNSFDKVFSTIDKTHKDGFFRVSYPNGMLKSKKQYKNGKLHGIYQEWFETGNLSLYVEYNEGELHGKYIVHSEDGTIRCYQIVKDGVRVNVEVGNEDDFFRPCRLSPFLREFLDIKEDIKCVRKEITEKVIEYCIKHVNPKDKTKIIPDGKIYNLIGGEFGKQITFIELQKILDKHFSKESTNKNTDIDEREQYKLIKEHAKIFIDTFYDLGGYAPNTINNFLNKILFIKEKDFSLEVLQEFRVIFEELKNELIPQIKKLFKTDPVFQALVKRFVDFSLLILTENSVHKNNVKKLLEDVNKSMTEAGRKEYSY